MKKDSLPLLVGVFRSSSSLIVLALTSLGFFVLAVLLPVVAIPGNTFSFQLAIYTPKGYLLLITLSVLVGIHGGLLTRARQQRRSSLALTGAASGASGLFAAVVGTAACSSCIASLFGLLGLGMGSVLFVLHYRTLFLAAAIAMMIISLYFATRNTRTCCYGGDEETEKP